MRSPNHANVSEGSHRRSNSHKYFGTRKSFQGRRSPSGRNTYARNSRSDTRRRVESLLRYQVKRGCNYEHKRRSCDDSVPMQVEHEGRLRSGKLKIGHWAFLCTSAGRDLNYRDMTGIPVILSKRTAGDIVTATPRTLPPAVCSLGGKMGGEVNPPLLQGKGKGNESILKTMREGIPHNNIVGKTQELMAVRGGTRAVETVHHC